MPLTPAPLMGIHPLLHFLSPLRERIRGEGALSPERERERVFYLTATRIAMVRRIRVQALLSVSARK
jgi:hypothetical protein